MAITPIDRELGDYDIECDVCGVTMGVNNVEVGGFKEVGRIAREEHGWASRRIDGEWSDLCPKCRKLH